VNSSESQDPRDSVLSGLALGCGAQLMVLIITGVLWNYMAPWLKLDWGWCLYVAWMTQWLALGPLIRLKQREEAFRTVNGLLTMGGLLMLATLVIWAVAADLSG
jgi:hypothetical protein